MFLLVTLIALASAAAANAATLQYPNLKTLPPRDLRFDTADVDASEATVMHNVLRFSNTVWNAGPGTLEVRGLIDLTTKTGPATQRVYDDGGGFTEFPAGSFYYHAAHQHYHYDNWGRYELWTKAGYEAWLASGRTVGNPTVGAKTTSCMIDEEFIRNVPNQPYPPAHNPEGCTPDSQGRMSQGISPGWGDTYDYYRFEQWIDLGAGGSLANGQYVLRSVVDPTNKIYESPNKADVTREGQEDNEAITAFAVQNGQLVDSNPPTGSVRINDIDASTSSPNVTVKVLGRDDISGVTQLRLSSDGNTWSTPQEYTGKESTAQAISWNLTNGAYGGNNFDGTKTVYVQFKDASGKWSASESDTIVLDRGGGSSAYSNAVASDGPVGYWRLGEKSGTVANDAAGANPGTYRNGALLAQPSLLPGDSANTSVRFDGTNDFVAIPSSASLSPTAKVSVEAWIKPNALPAAGSFASIASKPESYSLQFNGPRLEFTIMQSGARRRLQAPAGAILTGQAYHVLGTYDGTTQRLYINGVEVASAPLTGAITANASALDLGSWSEGAEPFNGTIDEVSVYANALSAGRVLAHYQAGTGAPPPDPTVKDPSNLSATAASETQIDLKWVDNSTNEGEFLIERDTSSSFTSPVILPTWANVTSFSDTGLLPGITYYYRVRARNSTDSSGYSNMANATTLSSSPPPTYRASVIADEPVGYWRLGEASGTSA
ncbi:MAG TPA: LamG-like jellyroll fold domain-containing protein, partial [Solirubrobacterales bacterium]|nr:LamG-like jellyroll fold domain-containing protein [Solirubrobacterales bacterium]